MRNLYELSRTHGIMYVERKGETFEVLFSLEDFEKIAAFAGTWHIDNKGYVKIRTRNKDLFLHNVVKSKPKDLIVDHINRNKLDNRQENLRILTRAQNMQNVGSNKRSETGIRGVSIEKRWNKIRYRARVTVNKKEISLGYYDTIEEAEKAVIEGRKKYQPYAVELKKTD